MSGRKRLAPETAALLAITALALCLRLYRLGHLSLWTDEGFTYWATQQSFAYLWGFIPTFDSHPPLFYTLLKVWTGLFGTSEAGLRGLSVLASTATVPVLWLAGRILGGKADRGWLGIAAAALFALAPVQLEYAQEARPYALVTLAAACAITGALWLALHPGAARRPLLGWGNGPGGPEAGRARLAWAALVLGAALAAWLHNLGAFVILALGLGGAVWLWRDLAWDRHALANAALALLLVALLWSPFLVRFLAQAEHLSQDLWIPPPDGPIIRRALDFLFSVRHLREPATLWPLLAGAALGLAALIWHGRSTAAFVLAAAILVPIALSLLVSVTVRSIFLDRTLLWTSVPFYLLLASALLLLRRWPWPRLGAALVVLAFFVAGVVRYYDDFKKEPWKRLTREVISASEPGDLLVVMPEFQEVLFSYYAAREGGQLPVLALPLPRLFPDPGIGGPPAIMTLHAVDDRDMEALRAALPQAGRVWVITRRADLYDPGDRIHALLAAQGRPRLREELVFQRILWLYLYGAPGAEEESPSP